MKSKAAQVFDVVLTVAVVAVVALVVVVLSGAVAHAVVDLFCFGYDYRLGG